VLNFRLGRVLTTFRFAALCLGVFLIGVPAQAQPPAPMHLTLAYDGRLIFKVLEMRFDEQVSPGDFNATVRLNSSGILAAFKHFDIAANTRGHTVGGVQQPGTFAYVNRDGKRLRHLEVVWGPGVVTMTTTPTFSNLGEPPATLAQKLVSADPLTQLVRVTLASTRSGPCNGDTHYFDGKQYYLLDLVPAGAGALSDHVKSLGVVNPIRCTVKYHEIAGFKAKSPEKRNGGLKGPITVTFGQLGPNGPWVIAQLQAETPLGYANISLRTAHVTGVRP
jgi:hypothetical protein